MKPLTFCIVACLLPTLLYAQTGQNGKVFSITGKIKNKRHGYVYLDYPRQDGSWQIDSCAIEHKKFFFKGLVDEPTLAVLRIGVRFCADDDRNAANLYIQPAAMAITARHNHAKKMRVTGSPMQVEKDSLDGVFAQINNGGHDIAGLVIDATTGFIRTHTHSYVSAFQLALNASRWDVDSVINLYNLLDSNVQNSYYGGDVKKIKDAISDNSAGKPAKQFTATGINGTSLQLASLQGHPLLIDFWASWCGPCRQATPHIKALYNKYHAQGLEVVGVSCDDNIQAWKEAVCKDSTGIWYNVLSNDKNATTPANNLAVDIKKLYAVYAIPVVVLIDRNGMIVGRYTGEDEETANAIDEKMAEVVR